MGDLIPIRKFIEQEIENHRKLQRVRMIKAYILLGVMGTIVLTALAAALMSVTR